MNASQQEVFEKKIFKRHMTKMEQSSQNNNI